MIQFFRQNNFLTSMMLLPYTFLLRIAFFWLEPKSLEMETGGVLYSLFLKAFEGLDIWMYIATNLCIAFTAVLINRLAIKHRMNRNQTLLPGLVYIIMSSWMEIYLPFSAIHIANYFLILAILSVFEFSKKRIFTLAIFDGSFFLGMAVMFYTPYVFFVVPLFLGFITLDSFKLRELVSMVVGFVFPFIVVAGFLFVFKSDFYVLQGYRFNTSIFGWFGDLKLMNLIPLIIYAFLLGLALFSYSSFVKKNNNQIQKKYNILYWFMLGSFFTLFLINERQPAHLLTLSFPLCIFMGILWARNKFIIIEEFLHLVLAGAIIYVQFNQNINFW